MLGLMAHMQSSNVMVMSRHAVFVPEGVRRVDDAKSRIAGMLRDETTVRDLDAEACARYKARGFPVGTVDVAHLKLVQNVLEDMAASWGGSTVHIRNGCCIKPDCYMNTFFDYVAEAVFARLGRDA